MLSEAPGSGCQTLLNLPPAVMRTFKRVDGIIEYAEMSMAVFSTKLFSSKSTKKHLAVNR